MTQQPTPSPQRILSQLRAHKAWEYIREASGENFQDKYATLTQKLGTMVLVNGLGPTVAFLRAKSQKRAEASLLYGQISSWVCERVYENPQADLLEKVMTQGSDHLRRATAEAIEFAIWLRRFSEAEFGDKLSEDTDG